MQTDNLIKLRLKEEKAFIEWIEKAIETSKLALVENRKKIF